MDVTVREYLDKDHDQLLTLSKKLGTFGKSIDPMKRIQNTSGFAEIDLEETLENVQKYQGKILLAEQNGDIIGFIIGVIWKQSKKMN
jgi:hypothetical protein